MDEEPDTINRTVEFLPGMPELSREKGTRNKIPEYFPALSIRISEALKDIGAEKCTVMERRETYLCREIMMMLGPKIGGENFESFHFGSQSEGTTTPGLNSDVDLLNSCNYYNIMTDWKDWKAGMINLLMFRDDTIPPQQYLLQVIRRDTPEPETILCDYMYVMKDSGQILFSSEQSKKGDEYGHIIEKRGEITKQGPSVSYIPTMDIVLAYHVCKPLPEIQHWIDRCRGRHWPPVHLLEAARVAPSFLVPAGHHDSDYKREEWRLSPNLIERMLMFSFNMTQIKCYIALKLIKESLFSKMVGDFTTSFHCKTVMFYAIERTHPSLWKDHNLMFLLVLCVQVLRKLLRFGRFPHYIIEGVNLFDGKLSKLQQRHLLQYVDYLLKTDLQDLFYINIDKLGYRLQVCGIRRIGQAGEGEQGRLRLRLMISLLLKDECLKTFLSIFKGTTNDICRSNATMEQDIAYKLRTCLKYSANVKLQTVALKFIEHLFGLHTSVQSSHSLQLRQPVFNEIIRRFKYSLNTDIASSRLKLASVLYCSGHLHAAVRVLEDVERRFRSKLKAVCGCRTIKVKGESDLQIFANMISDNCTNVISELPFAFCVRFVRQEAYCTPYILWFEMIRGITEEEVVNRNFTTKKWMDWAEVDARPFFHYLEYLTYGGLGERDKQLHSMRALKSYLFDPIHRINLYHIETAFNLLGHCYEMQGDYESAIFCYEISLKFYDTNNAANWHLQRIISGLE